MKKLIFIAVVMAATLASCQKKEKIESVANTDRGDGAITFSSYSQQTKASVATLDTLKKNGFGVFGMENQVDPTTGDPTIWTPELEADFFANSPQKVEYNVVAGGWKYSPIKYWSDDDKVTMDFIAFSPYDTSVHYYSGPTMGEKYAAIGPFEISPDIETQKDILLATKFDLPQVPKIVLEFQHALSRIGFSAYAPTLDGSDPTYSIQIVNVQLRGAEDEGFKQNPTPFFSASGGITLTNKTLSSQEIERTPTWEWNSESLYAFKLDSTDFENEGRITNNPARLNTPDKYVMVIPQNNMSGMEIYVQYKVIRGDDTTYKDKEFQCPVTEFKVNTAYTFNFKLGVSEVAFDCTVKDWDEEIYSLNASGEVYASSSREDCGVYVDAQRKTIGGAVSTEYNLYAEMKTVKEDKDSVRMFPVWKVTNRFYEGGGVHYGDLINVYLGWSYLEGVELNEEYIGESKYTILSFVLNDDNRDMLAGNYFAEYIEDPISAFIYANQTSVKNSVEVTREYSASEHITDPDWYMYPYTSTVTLIPTATSITSSLPFNKWQVSMNGGSWMDVDDDKSREYVLGQGATLTFEEDNVIYPSYSATKYAYRAVYGSLTDQIGMYTGEDIKSSPTIAQESAEQAIFYDPGTTIELRYPIPSGADVEYRYYADRYTVDYQKIVNDGYYTVATVGSEKYLTFNLGEHPYHDHNGCVIRASVTGGEIAVSVSTKTTSGNPMPLSLKKSVEWSGSNNLLVYTIPTQNPAVPYVESTNDYTHTTFFIYVNNEYNFKHKWASLAEACKTPQDIWTDFDVDSNLVVRFPVLPDILSVSQPYSIILNDSLSILDNAFFRVNLSAVNQADLGDGGKMAWVESGAPADTHYFQSQYDILRLSSIDDSIKIFSKDPKTYSFDHYNSDYSQSINPTAMDTMVISRARIEGNSGTFETHRLHEITVSLQ